jgi:predicted nucleic acid-binding protein
MAEPASHDDDTVRIVVADAGPLIHLDELQCLGLLAGYAEVRVPETVWSEVDFHRPAALRSSSVRLVKSVATASQRVDALSALYTLHAGEREALNMCLEFSGALLLTDDTAARLAAKALDIEARGTVGLLVRAIRLQQLTKEAVIGLLSDIPQRSSLHIRPGFLAEIIQQVSDSPEPHQATPSRP